MLLWGQYFLLFFSLKISSYSPFSCRRSKSKSTFMSSDRIFSVSVSVSAQTNRNFGFGSQVGFGRSLLMKQKRKALFFIFDAILSPLPVLKRIFILNIWGQKGVRSLLLLFSIKIIFWLIWIEVISFEAVTTFVLKLKQMNKDSVNKIPEKNKKQKKLFYIFVLWIKLFTVEAA